ncbi:MAG: Isoquinoline 1-oxidoreductase subunit [Afipia sp.]
MTIDRRLMMVLAAASGMLAATASLTLSAPADTLAKPEVFASVTDPVQRSAAYFTELSKVLTHPRCTNCHPASDRPRQGDAMRPHQPPVFRGSDGLGLTSLRCSTCHGSANFEPAGVPGHPAWHLAPAEMAWEGKTPREICAQIKDPARNGGRSLGDLVHHIGEDTLVGWAWHPGGNRTPAPGTQQAAKALVQAWIETGAACPN